MQIQPDQKDKREMISIAATIFTEDQGVFWYGFMLHRAKRT